MSPPEPEPEPEVIAKPEVIEPQPDPVMIQGLEPEESIPVQQIENEGPWELTQRADQASMDVAIDLRLDAIDGFLELQEFTHAETQANHLLEVPLNRVQHNRFNLQQARIALGFGQYQTAVQFLQPLRNDPLWTPEEWALTLKTLADAQIGLGQPVEALINLFLRDRMLLGEAQLASQNQILELVAGINSLEQALLIQSAQKNGLQTNLVEGWINLVSLRELPGRDQGRATMFWYNSYPGHPARNELLGGVSSVPLDSFSHIALLLPLTSPFGNAAQAFYDGFMDAYDQDTSQTKPLVSLYDIGEDPSLASFYYQSAISSGADFMVGPLGREAASVLFDNGQASIPTLVLADIPSESQSESLYGLSLSPEREARQVAIRAFNDGHRQAGIIHDGTNRAERVISAFTQTWLSLGGLLVTNQMYPEDPGDYSRFVSHFLEVNESVVRRKLLSARVGLHLEFSPRRREDMDLVFLVGTAEDARLLVPQLRFLQAHDMPIYATSGIFSGKPLPALDADLDGLIFGDMPWVLNIRYDLPETNMLVAGEETGIMEVVEHDNGPSTDSIPSTDPEPAVMTNSSETDILPNYSTTSGPLLEDQIPGQILEPASPEPDPGKQITTEEPGESESASNALPKPSPEPVPVAKSPYSFTPLDRLYALGLESHHLIPRLSALRLDERQRYYGQAFRVSVQPDGNVIQHMEWATFTDGNIEVLNQTESVQPVLISPDTEVPSQLE